MEPWIPFILLASGAFIDISSGLNCWTCDNQPSMFDCMFMGEIKTCSFVQDVCETKIRRCGEKIAVTKRCKAKHACETNAKLQVTPPLNQCNTNQENSVCTCCCEGEKCNLNSKHCAGMNFPCEARENIANGRLICTKGSEVGSICRYSCSLPGTFIHPPAAQVNLCQRNGEWNQPAPCCARSCPPFLLNDILFVRQANTEEAWNEFQLRIVSLIEEYSLRNDSARVGVLSYGSKVHSDFVIYLNEFVNNKEGVLEKIATIPYTDDTESIKTGVALKYIFEDYFTQENGDRSNVRNVIVLQADSTSVDDVNEIASLMRESGFVFYVVSSFDNNDDEYKEQLLEITGSEQHIFTERNATDIAYMDFLVTSLCGNLCDNVPKPVEPIVESEENSEGN